MSGGRGELIVRLDEICKLSHQGEYPISEWDS